MIDGGDGLDGLDGLEGWRDEWGLDGLEGLDELEGLARWILKKENALNDGEWA